MSHTRVYLRKKDTSAQSGVYLRRNDTSAQRVYMPPYCVQRGAYCLPTTVCVQRGAYCLPTTVCVYHEAHSALLPPCVCTMRRIVLSFCYPGVRVNVSNVLLCYPGVRVNVSNVLLLGYTRGLFPFHCWLILYYPGLYSRFTVG